LRGLGSEETSLQVGRVGWTIGRVVFEPSPGVDHKRIALA
jgi:hypothetical protein